MEIVIVAPRICIRLPQFILSELSPLLVDIAILTLGKVTFLEKMLLSEPVQKESMFLQ